MAVQISTTILENCCAVSNKAKYVMPVIYQTEINAYTHQETYARRFIVVLFTKGKRKPKRLSTGEWIYNLQYTMDYYSAMEINQLSLYAII